MSDILQSCLIESANVPVSIVQLESSWVNILAQYDYPKVVAGQLGELLAASVLLRGRLKQDSSVILQVLGKGMIQTLVAQAQAKNVLRGLAKWDKANQVSEDFSALYGDAKLVMTLSTDSQRYQGIIELAGNSLSQALEGYFKQSEQLPTSLWLFANHQRVAGLMLQQLPDGSSDEESWHRVNLLSQTVCADEMLYLSADEIIKRLYHQEDVRVYDQQSVRYFCSCSRDRINTVLYTMGRDLINEILTEQGEVMVDCEFCNQSYQYTCEQIEQLFLNHVSDSSLRPN